LAVATIDSVLAALDDSGVRFVVVGGVAVVLHGHTRSTVDLDLVVDLASDDAVLAIEALSDAGLEPRLPVDARDFADEAIRRSWIEERGLQVFTMLDPEGLLLVDVFAESPIPFEDLLRESKAVDLDGHEIHIASIDHLIAMKRAAGRAQDVADIEALESLRDG
jgi:predicted nucleotidyltransferase